MNYLLSDKNTLVWFSFTAYVLTALFLLPNLLDSKTITEDIITEKSLQFASQFVLRIGLIIPLAFLLKYAI